MYLIDLSLDEDPETYSAWLGPGWGQARDRQTGRVTSHPGVFFSEEFCMNGLSIVEAAALGRLGAMSIQQFISSKAKRIFVQYSQLRPWSFQ